MKSLCWMDPEPQHGGWHELGDGDSIQDVVGQVNLVYIYMDY